ncbi:AbrB/MazE/SpoVT family DNA-binding domain-containing protein [Tautonia plasticadhaerens]|uniref:Antitoxin MazE n=1 Tax=Tautonia plasticadhaerens TaxID=2527974 RepID=A0A518GX35_9BACT|nr:AbrB/MazE/SpoVT family DNA-binding domain-containing protein [Tautonia plasticadhaerens]QDV33133.1 Antitoxin MazE [Tautonia plasticadhaerens]
MLSTIQKLGEGLGVPIPESIAREAGLEEGTSVEVSIRDGALVVRPTRRYRLEDLLDQITAENRHDAFDTGPPTGEEVW